MAESEWAETTAEELAARLGLVAVMGLGVVVALYRSLLGELAPPIPYGFVPDLRPVVLFSITFALGAFASLGPGRRRGFLVAYLLAIHGVFAFDVSTIHWVATLPGPLGGQRADWLRLLALLTGLGAALLLQARVHAAATARDAAARGVPAGEAAVVAEALKARAQRAILLAAAGAGALGLLAEGAGMALGDEGGMPAGAGLVLGAAVLVTAAGAVWLARREAKAAP